MAGCERAQNSRGYCKMHYTRWYRYGDPLAPRPPRVCIIDGCGRPTRAKGLCQKHYTEAWRIANPEAHRAHIRAYVRRQKDSPISQREAKLERQRWRHLERTHGLTKADYEAMVERQDGRCLICRKEDPKLYVDHCHESGRVRGLLCLKCNTALGMLNEEPNAFCRALDYLAFHWWYDQTGVDDGQFPVYAPSSPGGARPLVYTP